MHTHISKEYFDTVVNRLRKELFDEPPVTDKPHIVIGTISRSECGSSIFITPACCINLRSGVDELIIEGVNVANPQTYRDTGFPYKCIVTKDVAGYTLPQVEVQVYPPIIDGALHSKFQNVTQKPAVGARVALLLRS